VSKLIDKSGQYLCYKNSEENENGEHNPLARLFLIVLILGCLKLSRNIFNKLTGIFIELVSNQSIHIVLNHCLLHMDLHFFGGSIFYNLLLLKKLLFDKDTLWLVCHHVFPFLKAEAVSEGAP
jgi:hypothetical protein